MNKETIQQWAKDTLSHLAPAILKIAPLQQVLGAVCDAAHEDGGMPKHLIEGCLHEVATRYKRK